MDVINYTLGAFVNIVLGLLTVYFIYRSIFWGMGKGREIIAAETNTRAPKAVTVEIPENADAREIGAILEENGLVSNKYIFWLQSQLNGTYKLFKSGEYELDMAMSSNEIMDTLQKETFAEKGFVTMTIAEGLNIKQIGSLAESLELFAEEDFIAACEDFDVIGYSFLENIPADRPNKLEGYLFPDTYYLPEKPEPEDLIVRMLNRFSDVIYEYEAAIDEAGITLDEAIITASLIEKEIRRPEERTLASSVIYNRLNIGMPLQIDSTVVYVLDKRKDRLNELDLQTESPYNTYLVTGLPIGPIANAGRASIEAAVFPADTRFLYYVVQDEDTGEHYFTADYDDFLAAKARYLSGK